MSFDWVVLMRAVGRWFRQLWSPKVLKEETRPAPIEPVVPNCEPAPNTALTATKIAAATGLSLSRAELWAPHINETLARFDLSTPQRIAMWLAQTAHESALYSQLEENLYYTNVEQVVKVFRRFDTNQDRIISDTERAQAVHYLRNPQKLANFVYSGRGGNGDVGSNEGWLFRARGCIGVTFKNNYAACGPVLGVDLLATPQRLTEFRLAALSAGWFWSVNDLNAHSDVGDVRGATKAINGGYNGLDSRVALFDRALSALI